MNRIDNMKKPYLPPMLEVFEYEVERGFAVSNTKIQVQRCARNNEEFTEITDWTGQNYTGEWF